MSPEEGDLALALKRWAGAIGSENVITEEPARREAETATFATRNRVPAILRPGTRDEVAECLRVATACRVAVYPISGGKNWGYGSRVPAGDGSVLMDLGRINRILDFSEELAYVTVEPGVTQAQLFEFLAERHSALWMDATGASPFSSLIGNTLERGFGHTPYGDHFAHSSGMEVVLPTGEIIETGFGRFASAVATPIYRWGVGASLDGLFTQSNFGVVTRMTLWLMPAPEYFQAYYFQCGSDEDLASTVDALRPLRLNGTIRSSSHIGNDYKVITAIEQYPWEAMGGRTPLQGEVLTRLRRELKIGAWNGSGALYGTRAQVKEARRLLRQALGGKARKLQFVDDKLLALASRFAGPAEFLTGWNVRRALEVLGPVYRLMKGVPTDHPLLSTYWRKRTPPPKDGMNPDRDGCGLLWCSPVVPNTGRHARRVTEAVTGLVLERGFEPAISLTMLTDRSLSCIISLTYDRDQPGEDAAALSCYQDLLTALAGLGYYSYRLSVASMDRSEGAVAYTDVLKRIKSSLDPAGILAPGRYLHTEPVPLPSPGIALHAEGSREEKQS